MIPLRPGASAGRNDPGGAATPTVTRRVLAAGLAALAVAPLARAEVPAALRIGMLTTLSGPGAPIGGDIRDGFALSLAHLDDRIGGAPVQVIEADDQQRPDVAVRTTERMLERNGVGIVTGTIWSNLALAMAPVIARAGGILLSPGAGPSELAGAGCSRHVFNLAFQSSGPHEAMGQHARDLGLHNVVVMAPDHPAGRDAIAGFRRFYDSSGGTVGELHPRLGSLDFTAEIARVASLRPDAVYFSLPGGMGIAFVRQWAQAGIRTVRLLGSGLSLSEDTLPAMAEAAVGLRNAAPWSPDLPGAVNERFVRDFRARFGRVPSLYAAAGYDAPLLLDAAARRGGGTATAALLASLHDTTFEGTRGAFHFDRNNFPVGDYYLREVVRLPDGAYANRITGTILRDHHDAYVGDCRP